MKTSSNLKKLESTDDTLIVIQWRLPFINISPPHEIHPMNINWVPTKGQALSIFLI